jgi:hypothetical protein
MLTRISFVIATMVVTTGFAHAGAWTQPKGTNWLKIGFMYQDTTERYFLNKERIPYFFDGRNRTRALLFEYVRGVTDRLDVKVQLPVFDVSFDDLSDERQSTGLGDFRIESRYNLVRDPLVFTVGGTIKFPTGEFINDAEIVPVGEGQYDFDVFGEVGRSLWPINAYVTGKLGYRFRTENQETGVAFGDEIVWRAEFGYRFSPRLSSKVLFRGLHGFEATSFGLTIDTLRRQIVYIEPGVLLNLTPRHSIEVTVPVSLGGRNWPAGPVFNISFISIF